MSSMDATPDKKGQGQKASELKMALGQIAAAGAPEEGHATASTGHFSASSAVASPTQSAVVSEETSQTAESAGSSGGARRLVLDEIARLGADAPPETEKKVEKKLEEGSFPPPAPQPTQQGPEGITFDFNAGARLHVPEGNWKVRFYDLETEATLFEAEGSDLTLVGRKKHYQRVRLEVEKDGQPFWRHDYDAAGKKVAVLLPGGTLGDSLAWFPFAAKFAEKHGCELTVVLAAHMRDLFASRYPHITFLLADEFTPELRQQMYATYYIGLFFRDETNEFQTDDFRMLGLHYAAASLLGVKQVETPPLVSVQEPDEPPLDEPYVVVAVQASSACKLWNNPFGWHEVVDHLKALGYRVVCIDKEAVTGVHPHWNHLPNGVEDQTGNRPLAERVRWLKHAEFFVGLSSGLSWLAWAARAPVVMISGFTHPSNEFYTPWRVFSTNGCNSCWHDIRLPFQHTNYLFCPRHEGTEKMFECTRIITGAYVNATIDRLMQDKKLTPPAKRRKRRRSKIHQKES